MIVIEKPEISEIDSRIRISVDFEIKGEKKILWYSLENKYEEYLVTEQLDAFLIGLLFLGLKTGNDIELKGALSARLYYSLNHYLIDALCLVNPSYTRINIITSHLTEKNLNQNGAAATGLSCGIDSLATYFDHIEEKGSYEIENFTYFNVGSHGDFGGDRAREIFNNRLKNISAFASGVNREVIVVDSNLSEVLEMKFQETYNLRTISCALLLQKLYRNYYYASGTRFDHFAFNNKEIADLDMLVIPNLSTESTSFFVSALKYSRIARTELISQFSETYDHLDVCTHPIKNDRQKINCSECYKCLRTMLTLELLGKLDFYSNVFDVDKFRRNKLNYIAWLFSKKNKLTLDRELIKFIKEKEELGKLVYWYILKHLLQRKKREFKSILK